MKVLDLGGACGHVFEGWFGSEQDFQDQLDRGLLECPVCGERSVSKRLSAPRINLGKAGVAVPQGKTPSEETAGSAAPSAQPVADAAPARLQALFWQAIKDVAARTEDVGSGFAEEARRIHRGDAPARGIRGQASVAEAQALIEEGVEVLPLPDLPVFKSPLQ